MSPPTRPAPTPGEPARRDVSRADQHPTSTAPARHSTRRRHVQANAHSIIQAPAGPRGRDVGRPVGWVGAVRAWTWTATTSGRFWPTPPTRQRTLPTPAHEPRRDDTRTHPENERVRARKSARRRGRARVPVQARPPGVWFPVPSTGGICIFIRGRPPSSPRVPALACPRVSSAEPPYVVGDATPSLFHSAAIDLPAGILRVGGGYGLGLRALVPSAGPETRGGMFLGLQTGTIVGTADRGAHWVLVMVFRAGTAGELAAQPPNNEWKSIPPPLTATQMALCSHATHKTALVYALTQHNCDFARDTAYKSRRQLRPLPQKPGLL